MTPPVFKRLEMADERLSSGGATTASLLRADSCRMLPHSKRAALSFSSCETIHGDSADDGAIVFFTHRDSLVSMLPFSVMAESSTAVVEAIDTWSDLRVEEQKEE